MEITEHGLIVSNRHWAEKHLNHIPFDWLISEMVKNAETRSKMQKALDKFLC